MGEGFWARLQNLYTHDDDITRSPTKRHQGLLENAKQTHDDDDDEAESTTRTPIWETKTIRRKKNIHLKISCRERESKAYATFEIIKPKLRIWFFGMSPLRICFLSPKVMGNVLRRRYSCRHKVYDHPHKCATLPGVPRVGGVGERMTHSVFSFIFFSRSSGQVQTRPSTSDRWKKVKPHPSCRSFGTFFQHRLTQYILALDITARKFCRRFHFNFGPWLFSILLLENVIADDDDDIGTFFFLLLLLAAGKLR